jgi:hypothetical protein
MHLKERIVIANYIPTPCRAYFFCIFYSLGSLEYSVCRYTCRCQPSEHWWYGPFCCIHLNLASFWQNSGDVFCEPTACDVCHCFYFATLQCHQQASYIDLCWSQEFFTCGLQYCEDIWYMLRDARYERTHPFHQN